MKLSDFVCFVCTTAYECIHVSSVKLSFSLSISFFLRLSSE